VQDDNHWVRNNAATALSFCGDEAPTVAPVLAKVLQEPDPQIRGLSSAHQIQGASRRDCPGAKASQRTDTPSWVKSELTQIDLDAGKTEVK
jgi:HEAT repeat protein